MDRGKWISELLAQTRIMEAALDAEDFDLFESALEERGRLIGMAPDVEDAEKERSSEAFRSSVLVPRSVSKEMTASTGLKLSGLVSKSENEEEIVREIEKIHLRCVEKLESFQNKVSGLVTEVRAERLAVRKADYAQSKYLGDFAETGVTFDSKN